MQESENEVTLYHIADTSYVQFPKVSHMCALISVPVAFLSLRFVGVSIYSRTSMARTSLGPWEFVRDETWVVRATEG